MHHKKYPLSFMSVRSRIPWGSVQRLTGKSAEDWVINGDEARQPAKMSVRFVLRKDPNRTAEAGANYLGGKTTD